MAQSQLRDLDYIHEHESGGRGHFGAGLLAVIAIAALLVVVVAMREQKAPPDLRPDPLGDLVAQAKREASPPGELSQDSISFPAVLSDSAHPTTPLITIKDERGKLVEPQAPGDTPVEQSGGALPPPAADVLAVAPLPVGDLLNSTAVTQKPKDTLTRLALGAAEASSKKLAPLGDGGGYQLQVASFRSAAEADALVSQLRRRDHRAHRETADIPGRGLWHRVRIGPFKTKAQALGYRASLEQSERLATLLVDPDRVLRQAARRTPQLGIRAALR